MAERLPAHSFNGACPAEFFGTHQPQVIDAERVYCGRCGARAQLLTPPPRSIARPIRLPERSVLRRHRIPENTANARLACAAFVRFMGLGHAHLINEDETPSWRFTDRSQRTVGYAKAISRSIIWGKYTTYAFSRDHWRSLLLCRDRRQLPSYLILTTMDDGARGYVEVDESLVQFEALWGARGRKDRGDPRDDEMMVHLNWDDFTRIEGLR